MKPTRRLVVMPDLHAPWLDRAAFKCMLGGIEVVKPTGFVCLGDFWEGDSASHWQWRKKKRPPLEYQLPAIDQEIADASFWLDELDKTLANNKVKQKIFCQGNHDEWLDRLVVENPFLKNTAHPCGKGYMFQDAFNIRKRGYKYYQMGEYVQVGKLYFYHGHHYAGIHHARNHLLSLGANVMYGHHHDVQHREVTHIDGAKGAWSIGCLTSMEHEHNEFLGRRKTNWGHAFAVVDFFGGGNFTVDVVRIVNGQCTVWGEHINGN